MPCYLKVATYNIHRCYGNDGIFDPQRISRVIRELDADVIALQEVETFTDGGDNILDMFETQTGYTVIPGPTLYRGDSSYGNAVLTKRAAEHVDELDISVPRSEPRGVISLRYTIASQHIHIIATHLGLKSRERKRQVQRITELIDQPAADVTVLMGDINEWFPWGKISRQLTRVFGKCATPNTFPSHFPIFALDQIRSYPASCIENLEPVVTPLTRKASDHLPLRATLQIISDNKMGD
ncbi:MAG: endonuclease/exonuclease/phosphatase family protein [Gammaproteobacteria bacterium]|jgi:endonuclease/exonuclease/phosphatase family metal-dependent hydrolase